MTGELRTVLLVEDDPDVREIALISLEGLGGLQVAACASGAEALEKAREERPDLVLLDYMMPGMDGAETLAALRRLPGFADVPVVFISAKARPGEISGFLALGAEDVITKPFDAVLLPDQVRSIWERARARDR